MTAAPINEIIERLQKAIDSLHKNSKVDAVYYAGFTTALANIEEYMGNLEEEEVNQ